MMLLNGNTNRIWNFWCGRYPGKIGMLLSPSYYRRIPLDKWMPFALDNGAYSAWRDNKKWDESAWIEMLQHVKMSGLRPMWAAVPDAVGDRGRTLENWDKYNGEIKRFGWPLAFCAQDGMGVEDVPRDANVIFVGGTDRWKLPNLSVWTKHFPRVHCARINGVKKIEACERLGCESVDGTAWFREPSRPDRIPALGRYLDGHRVHGDDFFL